MLSERRPGFGGLGRAQIDFDSTCGDPGKCDAVAGEFFVVWRDGEPGASPICARSRHITHRDEDSFDANYAHNSATLEARLSSVSAGCHRSQITGGEGCQGTLFAPFLVMIIDVQTSMLML